MVASGFDGQTLRIAFRVIVAAFFFNVLSVETQAQSSSVAGSEPVSLMSAGSTGSAPETPPTGSSAAVSVSTGETGSPSPANFSANFSGSNGVSLTTNPGSAAGDSTMTSSSSGTAADSAQESSRFTPESTGADGSSRVVASPKSSGAGGISSIVDSPRSSGAGGSSSIVNATEEHPHESSFASGTHVSGSEHDSRLDSGQSSRRSDLGTSHGSGSARGSGQSDTCESSPESVYCQAGCSFAEFNQREADECRDMVWHSRERETCDLTAHMLEDCYDECLCTIAGFFEDEDIDACPEAFINYCGVDMYCTARPGDAICQSCSSDEVRQVANGQMCADMMHKSFGSGSQSGSGSGTDMQNCAIAEMIVHECFPKCLCNVSDFTTGDGSFFHECPQLLLDFCPSDRFNEAFIEAHCPDGIEVFTNAPRQVSFLPRGGYDENTKRCWMFQLSPSFQSVTINFAELQTEADFDYVNILSCAADLGADCQVLAQFHGEYRDEPPSASFPIPAGGYVGIQFISDSSEQRDGFELHLTASTDPPLAPNCPSEEYAITQIRSEISGQVQFTPTYTETADCSWIISPQGASYVEVDVVILGTVQGFESVVLYSRSTTSSQQWQHEAEFSGSNLPEALILTTPMKVVFASNLYDFGYNAAENPGSVGFLLNFSATSEPPPPPPPCVTELNNDFGEIDYRPSGGYPNSVDCDWYIAPEEGAQEITLSFDTFAVEDGWDFVTVYQCLRDPSCSNAENSLPGTRRAENQFGSQMLGSGGYSSQDALGSCEYGYSCREELARLTGQIHSQDVPIPLVSTTGAIKIRFQSDSSYTDIGFVARYETAREIYQPSCGQVVQSSESAGYIDFLPPPPQEHYGNEQQCTWLISLPATTTSLSVAFPMFETEECCDKVRLFQCAQSLSAESSDCLDAVELWQHGGSAPAPIEFSTSRMLVTFTSDVSGVGRGFRLEYDSVQDSSQGSQGTFVVRFTVTMPIGMSDFLDIQDQVRQQLAEAVNVDPVKVKFEVRELVVRRRLLSSTEVSVEIEVSDQQAALDLAATVETSLSSVLATNNVEGIQFSEPPSAAVVNKCPGNEVMVDQVGNIDFWYTDSYPSDASCAWVIAPKDADSVTLQFTQFSTENNYDIVTVFACPDIACTQGQQIAEISGDNLPASLSTDTGIFKITFVSDSSQNQLGFQAAYEAFGGSAANCPSVSDPDTRIIDATEEGTIDFLSGYLNNAKCRWILQLQGDGVMEVSFPRFQTEALYDIVRVVECADKDCLIVDELGGDVVSGTVESSRNFTKGSSTLMLQFDSDSVNTDLGFVATFRRCRSCQVETRCPTDRLLESTTDGQDLIDFDFGMEGYRPLMTCSWIIAPLDGSHARLSFQSFGTEQGNDVVEIFSCTDKSCKSKRLVATFSGLNNSITAPQGPVVMSASGDAAVQVLFTSDLSTADRGFSASWTSLKELDAQVCQALTLLTEPTSEAEYFPPGGYPDDQTCIWIIAPQVAVGIELTIESLRTEPSFDTVTIRQCTDTTCSETRLLDTVSGVQANVVVVSATGVVSVEFNSDRRVNAGPASGFKFSWRSFLNLDEIDNTWPGSCPNVSGTSDCPTMDCCRDEDHACVDGQCKQCPVGTICFHGQFIRGRYAGETWLLDRDSREYYIKNCPPAGFEKFRPIFNNTYDWKIAQCKPCGLDRYVVNEEYKCQPCPVGSICECPEDEDNPGIRICTLNKHKVKVNGEEVGHIGSWEVDPSTGVYELESCPSGHQVTKMFRNSKGEDVFEATNQECRLCVDGEEYVLFPNQWIDEQGQIKYHTCQKCPVGAVCSHGIFSRGQVLGSVWKANPQLGVIRLESCPPGHQRVTQTAFSNEFDHDNQQCKRCLPGLQYIIDPNTGQCKGCPVGGRCDGSAMIPVTNGSMWQANADGEFVLTYCPPGSMLINMTTGGRFDAEVQECRACALNEYIVFPSRGYQVDSACMPCPDGARCDGSMLHSVRDGEIWTIDFTLAIYKLVQCNPGHMLVRMDADLTFSHDRCDRNEYIVNENKGYSVDSSCNKCPKGADCECLLDVNDAGCLPRSDIVPRVRDASWFLDPVEDVYYLRDCPRGHQLNNLTSDGTFSLAEQECEQCPAGTMCNTSTCTGKCQKCSPGQYKDVQSTGPCTLCPPHTFNINEGSREVEACKSCPLNSQTGPGVRGASNISACSCVPYYYPAIPVDAGPDYLRCEGCPPGGDCRTGQFTPRVASSRFVANASTGYMRVTYCPAGYVLVRSSVERQYNRDDCYMCSFNHYLLDEGPSVENVTLAQRQCKQCPIGADCSQGGTSVIPDPGYWRNFDDEFKRKARRNTESVEALVFPCPPSNCEEKNNQCREGHEGPVCGICKPNHVRGGGGTCLPCGEPSKAKDTRIGLAVAGLVLVGVALWYLFALRPLVNPFLINLIKRSCFACMLKERAKPAFLTKLQGIFKIVITALQVSTSFLNTFRVEWPSSFTGLMGSLWFTKLDFLELPGPACIAEPFSYQDMLVFKTLGPIILAAVLAFPWLFVTIRKWRHSDTPIMTAGTRPDDDTEEDDTPTYFQVHEGVVDQFWYAVVLLFFVVFPQVSVQSISAFNCFYIGDPSGKSLLAADWREVCPIDEPGFILGWSILFTIVYPVGLPLGLILILETYNVPSLSMDIINSARLKALLDHCGIEHKIQQKRCFFQNLVACLGTEAAQGRVLEVNSDKPHEYKRQLMEMSHDSMEQHVKKELLDRQKLEKLKRQCRIHFLGHAEETPEEEKEDDDADSEEAAKEEELETAINTMRHHDDLIDLTKLLIDRDMLGLPALGWVEDNDFEFHADEEHEGRGMWADMVAKFQNLAGSTDMEFFSDRDFQYEKTKALARAGFLFQTYEVPFWYFEMVEMLRKLLMTSILVFLYPGTPSQLAMALVISLIFLVLFMQVQPYLDPELDFLQTSTLVAQHCTLLYGIMAIMQENLKAMNQSREAKLVGWVVTILNMICVIWPLAKYILKPAVLVMTIRRQLGKFPCLRWCLPAEDDDDHFDNIAGRQHRDIEVPDQQAEAGGALPSTEPERTLDLGGGVGTSEHDAPFPTPPPYDAATAGAFGAPPAVMLPQVQTPGAPMSVFVQQPMPAVADTAVPIASDLSWTGPPKAAAQGAGAQAPAQLPSVLGLQAPTAGADGSHNHPAHLPHLQGVHHAHPWHDPHGPPTHPPEEEAQTLRKSLELHGARPVDVEVSFGATREDSGIGGQPQVQWPAPVQIGNQQVDLRVVGGEVGQA